MGSGHRGGAVGRRLTSALVTGALAAGIGLAGASVALAQGLCAEDRVTVIGDWGQARFTVEVADDVAERARGLMFVEEMATLEGMLFVYEREQPVSFWMENTLIPLDMIFAAADGTVVKVHENAVPLDRTPIPSDLPAQYVLEINGGLSAQLGIGPGDILQHPAIGPDPAAPCG